MMLIASIAFSVLLYGLVIGNLNLGSSRALIMMVAHIEVCIPLALIIVIKLYKLLGRS